jgi:hypothetical protein
LINTGSGAGVVRKINDLIKNKNIRPTFVLEEAQNTWSPRGSGAVLDILESYVAGIPRTILIKDQWCDLDLFVPCILNGRPTAEYAPGRRIYIPDNFFERCLEIKMVKGDQEALANLTPLDLVTAQLEYGDSKRLPRLEWSQKFSDDDIRRIRQQTDKDIIDQLGLVAREWQLRRGLAEYWWYCGDDLYKAFMEEQKRYITYMSQFTKRDIHEELLDDLWVLCDRHKWTFFFSTQTVRALKDLSETWRFYNDRPEGLNTKSLSGLLDYYDIKPDPDVRGDDGRGYQVLSFRAAWKNERQKGLPDHLGQFDKSDAYDGSSTKVQSKPIEIRSARDISYHSSNPSDPAEAKREGAEVSPRNNISSLGLLSPASETNAAIKKIPIASTELVRGTLYPVMVLQ